MASTAFLPNVSTNYSRYWPLQLSTNSSELVVWCMWTPYKKLGTAEKCLYTCSILHPLLLCYILDLVKEGPFSQWCCSCQFCCTSLNMNITLNVIISSSLLFSSLWMVWWSMLCPFSAVISLVSCNSHKIFLLILVILRQRKVFFPLFVVILFAWQWTILVTTFDWSDALLFGRACSRCCIS